MKIAWLIQGNEQWGIRSGSRALMTALGARGIACPVIALGPGEFTEECRTMGLPVTELGIGDALKFTRGRLANVAHLVRLPWLEYRSRKRVAAALAATGADALHFRRPSLVGVAGSAARANRLPAFWHMPNAISTHYPLGLNRRIYQSRCHRFGIVPLANSRYTAGTLGDQPVRPQVLYLAVDPDRFDPARIEPVSRATLGIGDESIVVGVAARLHPSKGQDRAIDAALQLVDEGYDLHLLVIGGPTRGDYFDRIEAGIRHSAHPGHIHVVGSVSDMERYYRMMDFSLNCRIDPEPFGISVIESMMCAVPPLVHAAGGPAESVLDGVTGWHYHAPSVADIREGLRRAIGDRQRWPEMADAARRHALENFSLDAQAKRYLGIVRAEIDRRAGRTPSRPA